MGDVDTVALIRIKSVGLSRAAGRKPCTLLQAARHNLREHQHEQGGRAHIDPSLVHLNTVIAGPPTAKGVVAQATERMLRAGVDTAKLRKDHVQAIEILFSLPLSAALNDIAFFMACRDWVAGRFGVENLLSAVIHRDEPQPHCHVLVLPLVEGRMVGSDLKRVKALADLRASFFSNVAEPFGLSRGPQRLTAAQRRALADAVLGILNLRKDPCMRSPLWQVIRDCLEANPVPFAASLGTEIRLPKAVVKRRRTMAQIFTSPGKGGKTEMSG